MKNNINHSTISKIRGDMFTAKVVKLIAIKLQINCVNYKFRYFCHKTFFEISSGSFFLFKDLLMVLISKYLLWKVKSKFSNFSVKFIYSSFYIISRKHFVSLLLKNSYCLFFFETNFVFCKFLLYCYWFLHFMYLFHEQRMNVILIFDICLI